MIKKIKRAGSLFFVSLCCLSMTGCQPAFYEDGVGASILSRSLEARDKLIAGFKKLDQSVKKKISKLKGAKQTQKDNNYKPSKGLVVEISWSEVKPINVKPGDEVTVIIEYAVMGVAEGSSVRIKEKKTLWKNNLKAAVLSNDTTQRQNGTWKSVLMFDVPKKVDAGRYKIQQEIICGDKQMQAYSYFEIK